MEKTRYITFATSIPKKFNIIRDECHGIVKPFGGLWGCRNGEWREWCEKEDFPCPETAFSWQLKDTAKLYTIDTEFDLLKLLVDYPKQYFHRTNDIDWYQMWKDGWDAVEITENANNRMHTGVRVPLGESYIADKLYNNCESNCYTMGLNTWDVPSICVFDANNTIEDIRWLEPVGAQDVIS